MKNNSTSSHDVKADQPKSTGYGRFNPKGCALICEDEDTAKAIYGELGAFSIDAKGLENVLVLFDSMAEEYPDCTCLLCLNEEVDVGDRAFITPKDPSLDWVKTINQYERTDPDDESASESISIKIDQLRKAAKKSPEKPTESTLKSKEVAKTDQPTKTIGEYDSGHFKYISHQGAIELMRALVVDADEAMKNSKEDADTAFNEVYSDKVLMALNTLSQYDAACIPRFKRKMKAAKIPVADWNKKLKLTGTFEVKPSDEEVEKIQENEKLKLKAEKDSSDAREFSQKHHEVWVCHSDFLVQTASGKFKHDTHSNVAFNIACSASGIWAFNPLMSKWHHFIGTHWKPVSTGEFKIQLSKVLKRGCDPIGCDNSFSKGVYSELESQRLELPKPQNGFIPFKNGVLSLDTKTLKNSDPGYGHTYYLPHKYKEGSECSEFMKWINHATGNDQPTIKFIQAVIAGVLTRRSDLHFFIHFIGQGGTGKGTMLNLLTEIVGNENTCTTDMKKLNENNFEAAAVVGKSLVIIPELDGYTGKIEVFKSMTGSDKLRIEEKGIQRGSDYKYEGIVAVASNNHIVSDDKTSALGRRRKIISFDTLPTDGEIKDMSNRGGLGVVLASETPQIINWALELTHKEVTDIIRAETPAMKELKDEAIKANNHAAEWADECCDFSDDKAWTACRGKGQIVNECLYANYCYWRDENGLKPSPLKSFKLALMDFAKSKGYSAEESRRNYSRGFSGVKLNEHGLHINILGQDKRQNIQTE